MSGVNKIILLGRIGKDPETKNLENGKVSNFTLATSEKYKKGGEQVEDTEWHNCTVYGGLSDVVEKYVKKGDLIYLEGKKKTRSWQKDGETKYAVEILVRELKMVGGKSQSSNGANGGKDDLPF